MKDKVEFKAYKEDGKVFSEKITHSKTENGLDLIKVIKEQMSKQSVQEYLKDDEDQMKRFKENMVKNSKQLKVVEPRLKEYANTRSFLQYKENYHKYELFEKLIELKINPEILSPEIRAELESYMEKRDSKEFKENYITMSDQLNYDNLKDNDRAYKDIEEEHNLFQDNVKNVLKLLEE